MERWRKVGCTAVIICLLTGCTGNRDVVPELKDSVKGQEDTAIVDSGNLYQIECYDAVTVPKTSELTLPDNAELDKLLVTIGDTVKEGDVLAVFHTVEAASDYTLQQATDDTAYELELKKLDLQIAEAQVKIYDSKSSLSEEEVYERDLLKLDITSMQLECKTLDELLNADSAPADESEVDVKASAKEILIKAPCNGTVAYRTTAVKGDTIPSDTVIFSIAKEQTIIESEFIEPSLLREAEQVYATIDGQKFEITVTTDEKAESIYSEDTGKKMFFLPGDVSLELKAGSYVPIYVVTEAKENVLYIPIDALKKDDEGYYVTVISGDYREIRKVEIGMITVSYVEIISGTQKGEIVFVSE